ncbi:MAG: alkaline phosphatase D family protein [Candidatus Nanopelagicales bacterium]
MDWASKATAVAPVTAVALVAGLVVAGCSSTSDSTVPQTGTEVGFPEGVASGAVSESAVKLWTRASGSQPVRVAVRADQGFAVDCTAEPDATWSGQEVPDPAADNTVHFRVKGLDPATQYYYRFCTDAGAVSTVGAFRTAPPRNADADVRFSFTGDATAEPADGQTVPFYDGFPVFGQMADADPDFVVFGGDVIYSDSVVGKRDKPTAVTRPEKWAKYRENLAQADLRRLRATTSSYNHWDDHEWDNGFYRQAGNQTEWLAGLAAFTDYMPVDHNDRDGLFSVHHWGRNLDLIVLDETSFRTEPVDEIPRDKNPCVNPQTKSVDRMPTASVALREKMAVALNEPSLRWPIPAACTKALEAPDRTILGARQFGQLAQALKESTARYRVIVSTGPMQQIYVAPYGRFEGYPAERARLLDLLARYPRVVTIATDVHASLINRIGASAGGSDGGGTAMEVTVGPAATGTRQVIWDRYFRNAPGKPTDIIARDLLLAPEADGGLGMSCAQLNAYSYATVEVTSSRLTITPRDTAGQPLVSAQGAPCEPLVVD